MALQIVARALFISALIFCARAACAQDIRIALAGSMTGPLAESGDEVKRGAELAAGDINAAGGVNGRKIVLSIEDDACDPKQAVSVANHIVGEQIALVDGHSCSNASVPASPVYAEYGVLMMTPSSVNSKPHRQCFRQGLADNHAALRARRQSGQNARCLDGGQVQEQEDCVRA
jgi:branched-chain amino acid transport system substrate-binding protein